MAIPENYIDKITKDGESRDICPAADKVRVGNENFDGTNLDDVLNEIAEEMDNAGDGTVTGVKVGDSTYEPTEGVVDLSTPFGGKVDKATGYGLSKNDYTDAEKSKLGNLPTADQLTQQMNTKANDNAVVKSITVNGQMQTPTNGNVNIEVQGGGLTKEDINVETLGDGTVDINVADDTYKINLNHEHQGMTKLAKFVASNPPASMANDTIYAQVNNLTTPTEIEALYIFGLEFTGGGSTDTPRLSSPGANISMGNVENGSVTKSIFVKGRSLTQDLSATLEGTGYTFATTQPTGVTRNSDTSLTIDKDAAIAGVNISVIYTGTAFKAIGSLSIISSSPDSIDVGSTLTANDTYSPYVLNGLDFWLDGEDLANGHWIDRVKGIDFVMNNVTAASNGGVYFNGSNAYGKYGSALGYTPTGCTIEIVADFSFSGNSKVLFMQNDDNLIVFGASTRSQAGYASIAFSSGPTSQKQISEYNLADGLAVFSAGSDLFYHNKTKYTVLNEGYYGKRSEAGTFVGGRTSSETLFTGTIYQIRIYNRVLSEVEILANQQVDIDRYNIS